MIEHPDVRRRVQEQRSQVALEILLVLWSIVSTVILARTLLVLMHIGDGVWVGRFVYGIANPVASFMESVPGLARPMMGPLTMTDLLLLAVVVLFPLGLLATSTRAD